MTRAFDDIIFGKGNFTAPVRAFGGKCRALRLRNPRHDDRFFRIKRIGKLFRAPDFRKVGIAPGSFRLIETGSIVTGTDLPLADSRVTIIGPMTAAATAPFPALAKNSRRDNESLFILYSLLKMVNYN